MIISWTVLVMGFTIYNVFPHHIMLCCIVLSFEPTAAWNYKSDYNRVLIHSSVIINAQVLFF